MAEVSQDTKPAALRVPDPQSPTGIPAGRRSDPDPQTGNSSVGPLRCPRPCWRHGEMGKEKPAARNRVNHLWLARKYHNLHTASHSGHELDAEIKSNTFEQHVNDYADRARLKPAA